VSALIYFFQLHPVYFLATIFLFGLLIGSFLNVVIHRLPIMMQRDWSEQCCELLEIEQVDKTDNTYNLITPRSRCPYCEYAISTIENIPVISYLFLKGRCKNCKKHISIRYPVIELITAIISAVIAYYFGPTLYMLLALILSWSLLGLAMIDADHKFLPDDIILPLLWFGILVNFFGVFTTLPSSVLGAIFGYGSLWLVHFVFKLVTGKQGMGHGDFKLLGMLGAWLGYQYLPLIIILSSLLGTIIGIGMIVFASYERSKPIPFGPYLAIAGWISLIWGRDIMAAYYQFIL